MRQLERLIEQPPVRRSDRTSRPACCTWTAPSVSSQKRSARASAASTSRERRSSARRASARVRASRPWPSTNATRRDSPGSSLERDLQRRARIEAGAGAAGRARSRTARPALASVRLRPTNSARSQVNERARLGGVPEGDAVAELRVVGVAREERAGRLVALGHDEAALAGARRAEAPLDVAEHAQAARRASTCWSASAATASPDRRARRRPSAPARGPRVACW